ncbi:Sulfite reductase, assimilatory-type [Candidatus Syntrophocurvum alkaliphilum]|uniref:Sulfite reductase, assimilatory-type n=1 Tax=Candidatus Syntrophocurvum alkaliphilum TaxID=2293317 RepID=A0A6I6DGZ7_9FIRM|nr:DUF1858 domain-containing protein [Candidatus Syntrophocurvum alkaliphilum]QGT99583.1 Sulfite reductase, assimilatory-type [Candidatus Syntrophocurvum alkaliphilum]
MAIDKNMTVKEVLDMNPKTADVFKSFGMQCLGCPSATGESISAAAKVHGVAEQELLEKLNNVEHGEMSSETASLKMPKGAVLQRDKKSFAIVPHLAGGLVSVEQLRKIADVAEKYNAQALKCTSAQRIAIVGLEKEVVDEAWGDLETLDLNPGHAAGLCLRSVKFCPGTTFCKRGQQDAVGLGMELDKRYHGIDLPSKMKMSVSGCANSCSEPAVRDIGLMGTPKGYTLMVGGNAGIQPRLGDKIANSLEPDQALEVIDKIVEYYKNEAKRNERLGKMIDRIGLETFNEKVSVYH